MKFINEMLKTLAVFILSLLALFVALKTNAPFPWSANDQLSREYSQL